METTVRNPLYKERIEAFLERQYFMKLMGFDLNVIAPGTTSGVLKLGQEHQQQTGLVHGGVIATVADIVAGFAAFTLVPEDYHVVTAELKISYFQPGKGDMLSAVGKVIKSGRKMSFCEAEVYAHKGEKKQLIAKATTTMAHIPPKS